MNSIPAIIFENIQKSFGSLKVLRGISGEIHKGEVVAIIGASGCGKSTLLRCFNRLEKIDAGKLILDGINLSSPNIKPQQLLQLRTRVGMVFQQFNLFPHLSVTENLTLAPRMVLGESIAKSQELATLYLEKVGLADKASAYPEQVSLEDKSNGWRSLAVYV